MNIYTIVIALLLGVVTFMGFQKVQNQEVSAPAEQVTSGTKEHIDVAVPTGGNVIDMRNQGLTDIPSSIFNKTGTRSLLLSDNNLDGSLPAEVRHLQNLQVLDLRNNNFTGVPAEIGQLGKLEILNLSGNSITGLPLELGNLQNLRVLDLRDTDYSQYDLDIIKKALPESVEIKT